LFEPNLQAAAPGVGSLPDVAPGAARPARQPGTRRRAAAARLAEWRSRVAGRKPLELLGMGLGTEISTDLGDSIGSRSWWLGLVACTALCTSAITLGTMVAPLPQLLRPQLTPAQREAVKPQSIAPLAYGAATGTTTLPSPRLVERLAEAPERPRLELTARVDGRSSFETLLRRAGVGRDDIAAVVTLVRGSARLNALPRGSSIDLVLGRRDSKAMPRPLESLGFRAAFDLRLLVSRNEAGLQLKRIPIAVDSTPLRVEGTVGGNLGRALRGAGIPANLAADFVTTMRYVVDFQRGVGKRDRFAIVVERDRAETGEIRYGRLLFAGLERPGKDPVELGRFDMGGNAGGSSQFYRANGESARKGLMGTPVEGARMTSGFGMRFHPLLSYSRMHQGVDFGAPMGAPILAAANGTVAFAGRHGGHGNYVQLKHSKELATGYAHMSRFAVRPGQSVAQGQVIGYVGSTGMSTGPHLHYEVWLRGRATNPVSLKFIGGSKLSGAAMARFQAMMNRLRHMESAGSAPAATDPSRSDARNDDGGQRRERRGKRRR
jgi:murein DD-endopeptidase MepM/ murein hydrolase activator NlpD